MISYFFIENGIIQGPFSYEEMLERIITPDTLVWRGGMAHWERARYVDELAASAHWRSIPPPVPQQTYVYTPPPVPVYITPAIPSGKPLPAKPPVYIGASVFLIVLVIPFVMGLGGIVFSSRSGKHYLSGEYEEAEQASRFAKMFVVGGFIFLAGTLFFVIFSR